MKNLILTLFLMVIGNFAFASPDLNDRQELEITVEESMDLEGSNNLALEVCEYCVYANHGTFCAAAGDCRTARQKAFQQAEEALEPNEPQAPESSFT